MKAFIGALFVVGICLGFATLVASIVSMMTGPGSGVNDAGVMGCCGSIFLIVVAFGLDKVNKS